MYRLVSLFFAVALLGPLSALAQVHPHRAEYSLRLGPAANAVRVGTAIHDLGADCGGWKIKRDINVELSLSSMFKLSVGSELEGDETRNGGAFRYRATQIQNESRRTTRGNVRHSGGEVRADITGPAGAQQFVLPPSTLKPISGLNYLIAQLGRDTGSFPALVFDPEVINDAFLVDVETLDRAALRNARPSDAKIAVSGKSWPVSLTFTRGRLQQQNPLFTVTGLVYETGVLDRLTVNTGLVSVTADLQSLDMRKTPDCPRS